MRNPHSSGGPPCQIAGGLHGETAGGLPVVHQLFYRLPAVGRFVGLHFPLDIPASSPERISQHPRRQFVRVDNQRNRAPGHFFFRQLYHLLSILHKV